MRGGNGRGAILGEHQLATCVTSLVFSSYRLDDFSVCLFVFRLAAPLRLLGEGGISI